MKKQDKENRKKLRTQDIIVVAVCVVAIIVIVLIVDVSNKKIQQKKEQLDYVQEQIQQENIEKVSAKNPYAGVLLNEINQNGWVEFYNNSDIEQSLKGLKILLDGEEILEIEDDTVLKAGEFVVYELLEDLGSVSHVFSIANATSENLFNMIVPVLGEKQSFGYVNEGSLGTSVLMPSKGFSNNATKIENQQKILFSVPGGFYEDAIGLEITAPKGWEIYYTTDGTEPTISSKKYESAIQIANRSGSKYVYAASDGIGYEYMCEPKSISMGTVIRAIAIDEKGKKVDEKTASYYIGIGENNEFLDMPVISITSNPEGLFDYFDGMYVSGRSYEDALAAEKELPAGNYLNGWLREAYIEYFEINKDKTYEGNIEIKMLEDTNMTLAQKGFQIIGSDDINKGSTLSDYMNGANATALIQAFKSDYKYRVRELIANELLRNSEMIVYQEIPCNVFINGEYWGGYLLKTPYCSEYIAERNDIEDSRDVILAENGVVNDQRYQNLYDDMRQFVINNDMSVAENYRTAETLMDMQSYIDYVCVNMYLANVDYGEQEVLWRPIDEEYIVWHWLIGDLDNTMGSTYSGKRSTASIDTYLQKNMAEDPFFHSLIKNKEFKSMLKETMNRMAEETFGEEAVEKAVNGVATKMQKMSTSSFKRFYGEPSDNFFANGIMIIQDFFDERAQYILLYTDEVIENNGIVLNE